VVGGRDWNSSASLAVAHASSESSILPSFFTLAGASSSCSSCFLIGEEGIDAIEVKESFRFLLGVSSRPGISRSSREVPSARVFSLAAERSCNILLDAFARRCALRGLGVKNLLKRFGVTDGFFFTRVLLLGLLRGLLCSSEAKAKLTCSLLAGRSGVWSIVVSGKKQPRNREGAKLEW